MADDDAIRAAFAREYPKLAGSKWHDYELHVYASGWRAREASHASQDANVERVRAKLRERSQVGIAKYGVTTERGDLSLCDWLTHLQEELMDAAVYVEAALSANRLHDAEQPTDIQGDDDGAR